MMTLPNIVLFCGIAAGVMLVIGLWVGYWYGAYTYRVQAVKRNLARWEAGTNGWTQFIWCAHLTDELRTTKYHEQHYRQEHEKLQAVVVELRTLLKAKDKGAQ